MHKHYILNLHKVVINFNSSNFGYILVNGSFRSIYFISNRENQESFISKTIYKSNNQISEIRTNIECKPVKNRLYRDKKSNLFLKKKQSKVAQKEVAKLQVAEKKKLEKERKNAKVLAKKALNKEFIKIEAVTKATKKIKEKAKKNLENIVEKTQNLKHKAIPIFISGPFQKKMMKKLPSVKKADTVNNLPVDKAYTTNNLLNKKVDTVGHQS